MSLKTIGHYGPFYQYEIGGHLQVARPDVILVHRMLKNSVPQRSDYALLTRPALTQMDLDPAGLGMQPHVERYEHFGDVECFVEDV